MHLKRKIIAVSVVSCIWAISPVMAAVELDAQRCVEPRLPEYITTHYTSTGGDGRERDVTQGEDKFREEGFFNPYYGRDADLSWMNLDKHGKPFNQSVSPAYNNYHNQVTAYNAIKIEFDGAGQPVNDDDRDGIPNQIEEFEQYVFEQTGYHVDILNYNPNVPVEDYLFENHPNIQIVHNVIYGNSLFTIMFPPYWTKEGSYPVKLGGYGWGTGNNAIFTYKLTRDAEHVGLSVADKFNGKGMLVVRSNSSGREAQGANSNAVKDVGEFMQNVMPRYGADVTRVVTEGASRGGRVALTWGANPEGYAYNTVAIHADVAPLVNIPAPLQTYATFPGINTGLKKILGSPMASRSDYADEEQNPPHVLSVEEKYAAARLAFSGTTDLEDAQSVYDVFNDEGLVAGLREKRIMVSLATHDLFMSTAGFLKFDNMLSSKEIPHRSVIGYGWGHDFSDRSYDVNPTLVKLVSGQEITPFNGSERLFYMPEQLANNGSGTERNGAVQITNELLDKVRNTAGYENYFSLEHTQDNLGFSAAIPHRLQQGEKLTVMLMGEQGKSWEVWVRKEDGYRPVFKHSGVFGQPVIMGEGQYSDSGKEYVAFTIDANVEPGRYEWFFKYNGKEIPNRFTPYVSTPDVPGSKSVNAKAVTEVVDYELVFEDYYHKDAKGYESSFGVDQYHPQLLAGNMPPVIKNIGTQNVFLGETLKLKISATDADGDPLVYDFRGVLTDKFLETIEFNGLTGELSYTPSAADVGQHVVKAIAKDGKGGIAEQVFEVRVRDNRFYN